MSADRVDIPVSGALTRRFEAWSSSDLRPVFADSVTAFRKRVGTAVTDGEGRFAPDAKALLAELFSIEPVLRESRMVGWPTLGALAEARLLVACLLAADDREAAYTLLRQQTRWCKDVLATFPIVMLGDYDEAGQFVLIGQLSYLLAHRYLKPEARHLADNSIAVDFTRTFSRVFDDEALRARVFALVEGLANMAADGS